MTENAGSGMKSEELSSGNDVVETTEFTFTIACEKAADGSSHCSIKDVCIDKPSKGPTPDVAVESPKTDTPPVAAAARKLSNDADCSFCKALETALREKVTAAAAPRRLPPSMRPRRMSRS